MFRKPGVAEVGALRICHNLRKYPQQEKRARARKTDQLLAGVPEADSQFLPSKLISSPGLVPQFLSSLSD